MMGGGAILTTGVFDVGAEELGELEVTASGGANPDEDPEELPGKNALDRGLGGVLAPTVVCARTRPCAEPDLACGSDRDIALLMRTVGTGIGVPFSMSSASRGCLRASARNICAPAIGGAGLRHIACSTGLLAIPRSAVFHTAGSSACSTLRAGARESAATKFCTPDMSLRAAAAAAGSGPVLLRGPEGSRKPILTVSCGTSCQWHV